MANKTKAPKVTSLVTLQASAKAKLTQALSTAYESVAFGGGSAALAFCKAVGDMIPEGSQIADADLDIIVRGVGEKRKWNRDTLKSRKSEISNILRASHALPAAVTLYQNKVGACGWFNVTGLARSINAGKSAADAVKSATKKREAKDLSPKAYAAMMLKRILKAKIPGDLRTAILKLAVDQRLNVGATG